MVVPFSKYQGTGNDFILIDNRKGLFPKTDKNLISEWCDRKFGIGSDGLILIESHATADFEMIFFNPDGSKSLCGNGSRCAVSFAKTLGLFSDRTEFLTTDGIHSAFMENGLVHFQLHDVPAVVERLGGFFVNNGSPHHIQFVEDTEGLDILAVGKEIRHADTYMPEGTNVNFVQVNGGSIVIRTFERGVEDETLSCGTGVVASSLAASKFGLQSPISVHTKGGQLQVTFETDSMGFKNIWLIGPAQKVFEGELVI